MLEQMNPFNKTPQDKKVPPAGGQPQPPAKIARLVMMALLAFMLISAAYIAISGNTDKTKEVSISDLANDVSAGTVKSIDVGGDDLTINMKDGTVLTAKKEVESSLSETLKNYGVSADKISATDITISS